jgi:hypothetical protein
VNGDDGVCTCEEKGEFAPVLAALLGTDNPPINYALTESDVKGIAGTYDWETRVDENNWSRDTDYNTLAEMIVAEPASFLADISRYYGDDYYLGCEDDDGDF